MIHVDMAGSANRFAPMSVVSIFSDNYRPYVDLALI
jgi:hypothetical protein